MSVIPGFENHTQPLPNLNSDDQEDMRNYADDHNVVNRIKNEIIPLVEEIRKRRSSLNNMWSNLLKVWTLQHEVQGYEGRSNVYMPAGKKAAETLVSQLVSGTFPGDDEFGVEPRRKEYADRAINLRDALRQRIDNVAKVRIYGERFYRQLVLTGNSPVKIFYDKRTLKTRRRSPLASRMFAPETGERILYDGPVFKTIDCANFYVYPETAESFDDVAIVFEDLSVSLSDLRVRAVKGTYNATAVEEAAKGSRNADYEQAALNKLESQGISSSRDVDRPGWSPINITELWLDFDPKAHTKDAETHPEPFLITFSASGAVLRVQRNPFWHKRPPYLMGRMGTMTGRFYGTGYVEAIRQLQQLLNDQTNQGMDAANFVLNPIFLVNPNMLFGALKPLAPGVQYLVNDVNQAIKTMTPDSSVINTTSILTTQTAAWLNDYSGAPPVLSGGSSPGRAFRTATGIGTAMENARVPLQEIIRLCEAEVWEQMLYMFWTLDQQFAEDDFIMWMEGNADPRRFSPKELSGDWMFKWLASTKAQNQNVKGSQIVQLLQLLGNPAIVQLLQQNQVRVNPAPLVKRLYREVFGFRDVDQVVIEAALGPQAQPQVPNVQGPPQQQANPEDPGYDLPPGLADNPEFDETREAADALAAAAGAAGGPLGFAGA